MCTMQHMDIVFGWPTLGPGITETKTLPPNRPWPDCRFRPLENSRFEVEVVFQTGEKDKVESVGQKIKMPCPYVLGIEKKTFETPSLFCSIVLAVCTFGSSSHDIFGIQFGSSFQPMATSGFGSIWGWVESVHMVACQRKQTDFAGIGKFPQNQIWLLVLNLK